MFKPSQKYMKMTFGVFAEKGKKIQFCKKTLKTSKAAFVSGENEFGKIFTPCLVLGCTCKIWSNEKSLH